MTPLLEDSNKMATLLVASDILEICILAWYCSSATNIERVVVCCRLRNALDHSKAPCSRKTEVWL